MPSVTHHRPNPRHAHRAAIALAILLVASPPLAVRAAANVSFDFEQRFFFEPGTYLKDHTLIAHGDRFHLFYIVGHQGEGWGNPGNEIDFGHASSTDLIHWEIHDRVLSIEPGTWKDRNLWAPHVVPLPGGGFLMAYTGVDSSVTQQTGLALSPDLQAWGDLSPLEAAYAPDTTWALWNPGSWSNCRDPFIRYENGTWIMLNTASARPEYAGAELGAISLAFSTTGFQWVDAGAPLALNDRAAVLESPFLYTHGGLHYLFFNEGGVIGLQYTTSVSLITGWDVTDTEIIDSGGFACEILDAFGHTWFSRVRAAWLPDTTLVTGALIDTLGFAGTTPVTGQSNTLWTDWRRLPGGGAFNFQPTFGDRPAARSGIASGIEGRFWINTGEVYAEPVAGGCIDCGVEDFRTGVLQSHTFFVAGDSLELLVGGGDEPDSLYVGLRDASDDRLLFQESGSGGDALSRRVWDLRGWLGREVYLEIADLAVDGHINVDAIHELGTGSVAVAPTPAPAPGAARLAAAPNPATRSPAIRYVLDRPATVRLAVHDARGGLVRLLVDGPRAAGGHTVRWDGRLESGSPAPSGVYFVRLELDGQPAARTRLVRIR
jgi:hypothetical protein